MSDDERRRWDERYRAGERVPGERPSAFLTEWVGRLPRGRALDVACGAGRNGLFLTANGYEVDAVDLSPVALAKARAAAEERGLSVRWVAADLEQNPDGALPCGPYALIVLIRYVNPVLLPLLRNRLAPGGALLIEQHVDWTNEVAGPRNPAFRLRRNALLEDAVRIRAAGYTVRDYREGLATNPNGEQAALAQLLLWRDPE